MTLRQFYSELKGGQLSNRLVILLISGLILIILINLTNRLIDLTQLTAVTQTEIQSIKDTTQHSQAKMNTPILQTGATQKPLFGASESLSLTPIDSLYTLIGIKYSPNSPKQAMAFIQTTNEDSDVYTVGDNLPKGGTVDSINQSGVTVLYHGIKETLQVNWENFSSSPEESNISSRQLLINPSGNFNNRDQIDRLQQIRERINPGFQEGQQ